MNRDLSRCSNRYWRRLSSHFLQLNSDEPETHTIGSDHVLSHAQSSLGSLANAGESAAKSLGALLDSGLVFGNRVNKLVQTCFHLLRNISSIKLVGFKDSQMIFTRFYFLTPGFNVFNAPNWTVLTCCHPSRIHFSDFLDKALDDLAPNYIFGIINT